MIACCGQICYLSVFLMMFLNCGQISCFGLETLDLDMYQAISNMDLDLFLCLEFFIFMFFVNYIEVLDDI